MSIRNFCAVALVAAATLLTGCATSRSEVKLASPPPAATPQSAPNGRTVVIRSVKDERVFQEAPGHPGTPSLGSGGASKAGDDVKARAVARKRNSYGQALGDVLLDGQTVTGVVREHLAGAFRQAGYQVAEAAPAAAAATASAPILVDVRIRKFWAWMQPGFWALTFNADMETLLEVSGTATPTNVSVSTQESRQMGTDDAWVAVLQKALADYRAQAAAKLAGGPF